MSITVSKRMTTETAHRLCNYEGKCAHIHGHSYTWEVEAGLKEGAHLDSNNGILLDFSLLKKAMRQVIYDPLDHALVLWNKDPLLDSAFTSDLVNASDGSRQKIVWTAYNPTAEEFAIDMARGLQVWFDTPRPSYIQILRVTVWETADSFGQWTHK